MCSQRALHTLHWWGNKTFPSYSGGIFFFSFLAYFSIIFPLTHREDVFFLLFRLLLLVSQTNNFLILRLQLNLITAPHQTYKLYPIYGTIFLFLYARKFSCSIFVFCTEAKSVKIHPRAERRKNKPASDSPRATFCGRCSHTNEERIKIGEWFRLRKSGKKKQNVVWTAERIKSWLNSSRMEIKTAEIVEGWEKERERETSTETTMREKLGISCRCSSHSLARCEQKASMVFLQRGGMMMLSEEKKRTP